MYVLRAVHHLQPMETFTENTVHMIATSRQDSKAVKAVTKEQMAAETKYQASIAPFRLMLNDGVISAEDYQTIDTILTDKYCPLFIQYTSPN